MSKGVITAAKEGILLNLKVSPGAKHTAIAGPYGESAVKLRVAAPPTQGRANAEVSRYLAALLEIPPSDVSVTGGASGTDKTVLLRGVEEATVREALAAHLP